MTCTEKEGWDEGRKNGPAQISGALEEPAIASDDVLIPPMTPCSRQGSSFPDRLHGALRGHS